MVSVKPKHVVAPLFNKCSDCIYTVLRDDGYSNYTVEGTTFNCAKALHPQAPFDNFYEKAPELYYAERCPSFTKGEPLHIDVEEEVMDHLTEQHRHVLEVERTTKLILQA